MYLLIITNNEVQNKSIYFPENLLSIESMFNVKIDFSEQYAFEKNINIKNNNSNNSLTIVLFLININLLIKNFSPHHLY